MSKTFYALRRSAVSSLVAVCACSRRCQTTMVQNHTDAYNTLMGEMLAGCGDAVTQVQCRGLGQGARGRKAALGQHHAKLHEAVERTAVSVSCWFACLGAAFWHCNILFLHLLPPFLLLLLLLSGCARWTFLS